MTPNHHRPGGGFQNPWGPESQPHGITEYVRSRLATRFSGQTRNNDRETFRAAHRPVAPNFAAPRAGAADLVLTWAGHSSFLVQIGGRNLLTDPQWSEYASPIQGVGPRRVVEPGIAWALLPPIDGILISHDHYDHLDRQTVSRLVRSAPDASWAAPLGVGAWLRRQGVRQVVELDWWDSVDWGVVTLTATPAQHFSGRGLGDRNATLWCGFVARAGDRTLFYAGDSGRHPVFGEIGARLGPFDAACMPIGAYDPEWFMGPVHMNPEQAVGAFRDLGSPGAVLAAMHWGTFILTDEPLDEPPRRAAAAWQAAGLAAERLWIPAHGETRVIG